MTINREKRTKWTRRGGEGRERNKVTKKKVKRKRKMENRLFVLFSDPINATHKASGHGRQRAVLRRRFQTFSLSFSFLILLSCWALSLSQSVRLYGIVAAVVVVVVTGAAVVAAAEDVIK